MAERPLNTCGVFSVWAFQYGILSHNILVALSSSNQHIIFEYLPKWYIMCLLCLDITCCTSSEHLWWEIVKCCRSQWPLNDSKWGLKNSSLSRICTPTGLRSWSGNLQRGWGAFLYKSESPQGFGAVCLLLSRNTLLFVYAFFISSSFQYFNLWLNLHVQREFFVVVFWGVGHRDHLKILSRV